MFLSHVELKLKLSNVFSCSRMTVDKRGQLIFCHVKDATFDVSDFLIDLKGQLKFWRDVYWRMWGAVNFLACGRCGERFPLTEFAHCKYHPEAPRYDNDVGAVSSCCGVYPCCQQKTIRFDPTQLNKVRVCVCVCVSVLGKEGNVLFNYAHNTFYLRLYGIRHVVKDHSDSERGERDKCFI